MRAVTNGTTRYLHVVPDGRDLRQAARDGARLLRVLLGEELRLLAQLAQLVLDGGQVSLHPCQPPLQSHDPGKVVAQVQGGLNHLGETLSQFYTPSSTTDLVVPHLVLHT